MIKRYTVCETEKTKFFPFKTYRITYDGVKPTLEESTNIDSLGVKSWIKITSGQFHMEDIDLIIQALIKVTHNGAK